MNPLFSPIGDHADTADELPRTPISTAISGLAAAIFAVSCIAAAAIHFFRG
ncbi:hypothetical protein [Variovorax sp. RO1]|uniref:hypothetical protein n=1 Tax=Variovorax sp. RO1 TaxID=2066034 RepID=UPI0015DE5C2B|nr:hypothetical protein [Variovorax sp. RO1]